MPKTDTTGLEFYNLSTEWRHGMPQWPSKALVMIGFTLLLVQGVSELIKRLAIMRDMIPDPHESQKDTLEAEVEHIVEAIEKR